MRPAGLFSIIQLSNSRVNLNYILVICQVVLYNIKLLAIRWI